MKKRVIIVGIIVAIIIVGLAVVFGLNNSFLSPKESEKNPNNPPSPNQNGKLSQLELEKYLLEKRLDLQKYFVFNLQKEVKAIELKEKQEWAGEERPLTEKLATDLTKITDYYWKKVQQSTEWTADKKTEKNYTGKESLSFGKKIVEEWEGRKLNQKINNGGNWYIIFEKDDWELYFYVYETKKKVGLHWAVIVPIDTPACQVFKDIILLEFFYSNF